MTKQISTIVGEHPSIVGVVGDGHVPGLIEALKPLEVETVRLKELRQDVPSASSSSEYSSSFWYGNR